MWGRARDVDRHADLHAGHEARSPPHGVVVSAKLARSRLQRNARALPHYRGVP